MAGNRFATKQVGASSPVQIKSGSGTLVGIFVTVANALDKAVVVDNTEGSTEWFTVDGGAVAQFPNINAIFANGLRVVLTGTTARYLFVYE